MGRWETWGASCVLPVRLCLPEFLSCPRQPAIHGGRGRPHAAHAPRPALRHLDVTPVPPQQTARSHLQFHASDVEHLSLLSFSFFPLLLPLLPPPPPIFLPFLLLPPLFSFWNLSFPRSWSMVIRIFFCLSAPFCLLPQQTVLATSSLRNSAAPRSPPLLPDCVPLTVSFRRHHLSTPPQSS